MLYTDWQFGALDDMQGLEGLKGPNAFSRADTHALTQVEKPCPGLRTVVGDVTSADVTGRWVR